MQIRLWTAPRRHQARMVPRLRQSSPPAPALPPRPPTDTGRQVTYAVCVLATVCFAFTKLAMIAFYLRFATSPRFRAVCLAAMAYMALTQTTTALVNLFGCRPISGGWDRRPENPSVCVTTRNFYVYASASSIWTDIMLLVLPIPILLRLRLGWKAKLGLVGMFSMGFV